MKVVSHASVTGFWQVAGPLFAADPVRNTIAMTVLGQLLAGGQFSEASPIFLTIHDTADGDRLVGATFRTPPFPFAVTAVPVTAMAILVDYLIEHDIQPGGATGMQPQVEAFAAAWARRTGEGITHRMAQRLYRLGELRPPTGVPGEPVIATEADEQLLADWYVAFNIDAHVPTPGQADRDAMLRQVRDQRAAGAAQVVWRVVGEPVALAVISEPGAGMCRIGRVYTPSELRGRGYGSAVTAAASRWGLDQGAEHVLLFTDLANPVSNSIYQRIGFIPVADALDVGFGLSG